MYGAPGQRGVFDCVVTCFFLDTAHNVIAYMETIWHALRVGNKGHSGVWGVHRLGYKPVQRGAIDCVATYVQLDTAHNVIAYMDTVWHALRACPPTWVTNFISKCRPCCCLYRPVLCTRQRCRLRRHRTGGGAGPAAGWFAHSLIEVGLMSASDERGGCRDL